MTSDPLLVTNANRKPIKVIAQLMRVRVETAIRRCRRGELAHQVDATGRYWSSAAAVSAFFGEVRAAGTERVAWRRRAAGALHPGAQLV